MLRFLPKEYKKKGKEKRRRTTIKGISQREWHFIFFVLSLSYIRPSSISDQYNTDVSVIWKVYMEKVDLLSTCI
jgi:hypothetical protein